MTIIQETLQLKRDMELRIDFLQDLPLALQDSTDEIQDLIGAVVALEAILKRLGHE